MTDTRAYRNESDVQTRHPNWMSWVPDNKRLSELSLPGTHDSGALHGGLWAECQALSIRRQLNAGIRVLDVRCRHYRDGFQIHHDRVHQEQSFGDVLTTVCDFLDKNPSETVLMRVKKEYDNYKVSRKFQETFQERYWEHSRYRNYFWTDAGSDAANPRLDEVRGKIVVLRDFDGVDGVIFGPKWKSFKIQDDYKNTSSKWEKVKAHFKKTDSGNGQTTYVNFLSANSLTSPPSRVADDVNVSALKYLFKGNVTRAGWVMMDFPGAALIDAIVAHNMRLMVGANKEPLTEDFNKIFKNIAYSATHAGEKKCDDRRKQIRNFVQHVIPGQRWNVIACQTKGAKNWFFRLRNTTLYNKSDWIDGFCHVAFISRPAGGGVSERDLEECLQGKLNDTSGGAESRSEEIASIVRSQLAGENWNVLVKKKPGGYDNWAYSYWGTHFKKWRGDFCFVVWAG